MTDTTTASVLHGSKDLRLETRPLPAPQPNEVQLRILSTGLCGSDLHYYNHFRNGDIKLLTPIPLGHESSGEVVALGSSVTNLSIGDRVALEVGVPCESCARCEAGRYNICAGLRFRSSGKSVPHYEGTLQGRINHPARWCWKLPEGVGREVGALLEPLGVALHAWRRCGVVDGKGKKVVVFGAGAVGLLCGAVARLKGAEKVVVVDVDEGRLKFAVENGFADAMYLVGGRRGKDVDENLAIAKETAAEIGKVEGIGEVDVVFECTGVPSCVQAGIYATAPGGRVMLVGMGHPVQTIPLAAAALREVDIVGVFRYANTYKESIELVVQAERMPNGPKFAKMVTHRFDGLDQADKAFEMAAKTKDDQGNPVVKVVIDGRDD